MLRSNEFRRNICRGDSKCILVENVQLEDTAEQQTTLLMFKLEIGNNNSVMKMRDKPAAIYFDFFSIFFSVYSPPSEAAINAVQILPEHYVAE